jgi:hypothetical protein
MLRPWSSNLPYRFPLSSRALGQPTEPQLEDLHALGIRHIVNLGLHSHEKALPDETASVSRLGMTYIHSRSMRRYGLAAPEYRPLLRGS